MYTTYGIVDPTSLNFVYVGQTDNFERRKRQHLRQPRTRKTKYPKGSIEHWKIQAHRKGITPVLIILDMVETEAMSLESENNWVEKLATARYPLLNRWEEHKELIEVGRGDIEIAEYHAFWPGKWNKSLGVMVPTPKGAGFSLTFPEEIMIRSGGRLVIMPTKKAG